MKSLNTITKSTILAVVVMTTSMGVAAASSGYSSDGDIKRTTTVTTTTKKEKRVVEERIAPRRAHTPVQYNNPDPVGSLANTAVLANAYRQPQLSTMCRTDRAWCSYPHMLAPVGSPCFCTVMFDTSYGHITPY